MSVYLLHATRPLQRGNGQAVRHYLGYAPAEAVAARVHSHQEGPIVASTPRIVAAYRAIGAKLLLVRLWPDGSQGLERYLKRAGHLAHLCPVCAGAAEGKELSPWQKGQPNSISPRRRHQYRDSPLVPLTSPPPEPPTATATPRRRARTATA